MTVKVPPCTLACVTLHAVQDLIGVDMEQMGDLLTVQESITRGEKVRKHLTREKAIGEWGIHMQKDECGVCWL